MSATEADRFAGALAELSTLGTDDADPDDPCWHCGDHLNREPCHGLGEIPVGAHHSDRSDSQSPEVDS